MPKGSEGEEVRLVSAVDGDQRRCSGTAETGRTLAPSRLFYDVGPRSWRRVEDCFAIKEALAAVAKAKWAESTSGPEDALDDVMIGPKGSLRKELKDALIEAYDINSRSW